MKKKQLSRKTSTTKTKAVKSHSKPITSGKFDPLQIPTTKLLNQPENTWVDFKRNADSITQEDLIAFSNAGGGVIIVGVDEVKDVNGAQRGKIVGCSVSDKERNKIVSRAKDCRPSIAIQVLIESIRNKSILRVQIPGGLHCTPSGTYKIRRDGQTGIIDPSEMVKIVVNLKREEITHYLKGAIQPDIDNLEDRYDSALAEIEELRSQLDDLQFDEREDY